MAKRKPPLWTISRWVSDKDKRAEVLLTVLVVLLVVVLLLQSWGVR